MPADPSDTTHRVIVPPNVWTRVLIDQKRDETIEVFHTNGRSITFLVDTAALTIDFDTSSGAYPEDGWRIQGFPARGIRPIVENRQARVDAAIRAAIDAGLLIEVDQVSPTGARYELADAGKRHSEQQLGLPDGALG